MKKILFLLLLVGVTALSVNTAHAQKGYAAIMPTVQGDTLNNADTVAKLITASAGYSVMGIQVNLTKISGTVAGKVYLYQSLDKVNYTLTDSAVYSTAPTFTSTIYPGGITPTATNVAIFQKNTTPSVYYMVEAVSSGTVSAALQVLYTTRQYFITKP